MQTFIALLRGINVSGQKKIRMADLKQLMENLGFRDVQTYIQSGNVVFRAGTTDAECKSALEGAIREAYGFEVEVFILQPGALRVILENNPFLKRGEDPDRLYVTFLASEPDGDRLEKLRSFDCSPEAWEIAGTFLYFFAPNGYGRAKMNNNFFESKLKIPCTTRNWRTVQVLFEMGE